MKAYKVIKSNIHRKGLCATRNIKGDERIIEYKGKKIIENGTLMKKKYYEKSSNKPYPETRGGINKKIIKNLKLNGKNKIKNSKLFQVALKLQFIRFSLKN